MSDARATAGAVVRAVRARLELSSVVIAALVAASLWVFAEVADEVVEGETRAFDRTVVTMVRSADDPADPLGPRWFEEMARDYTALGGLGVLLGLTLSTAGFLALQGNRRTAVFVLVSIGLGTAASFLLKDVFDRPRPDLVPQLSYVHTASFPSGHSMLSALTYLTLAVLIARTQSRRRVKAFVIAVALVVMTLVGLSRVYLGVHYPTDVVAGWTAGAGWALGSLLLARWLARRGEVEPEAAETR